MPLLALLFIIILSSLKSVYFFNTQLELHRIITYLILFIVIAALFQTEKRLKLLAYCIIGTAAIAGLTGFSTFMLGASFNICVSMGMAFALAFIFCDTSRYVKIALGIVFFILLGSSIATFDRGCWLGVIAMIIFLFVLLGYEGLLREKFWFLVLFFILFLWATALFTRFDKIVEKFISVFIMNPKDAFIVDYDTTIWDRISIWESALKVIRAHPFLGVGLGNFELAYPLFRDKTIVNLVDYAHQDYLQFAVESGLLGLLSLLWLGSSFFKKMFYGIKCAQDTPIAGLKIGAFSSCFVMILYSLYDFGFHIPSDALLFMVSCGILMALYFMQHKDSKKIEWNANIARAAHLASIFILAFYMAYLGKLFMADVNYKNGVMAMNNFLFTKAEKSFKRALFYVPQNAEYAARLGELYTHRSRFKNNRDFYQKQSIDSYRKAVFINPYNGNLHIEAAIAYARCGQRKEAEKEFGRAISLDPNNAFYRAILARYAVEEKKSDETF